MRPKQSVFPMARSSGNYYQKQSRKQRIFLIMEQEFKEKQGQLRPSRQRPVQSPGRGRLQYEEGRDPAFSEPNQSPQLKDATQFVQAVLEYSQNMQNLVRKLVEEAKQRQRSSLDPRMKDHQAEVSLLGLKHGELRKKAVQVMSSLSREHQQKQGLKQSLRKQRSQLQQLDQQVKKYEFDSKHLWRGFKTTQTCESGVQTVPNGRSDWIVQVDTFTDVVESLEAKCQEYARVVQRITSANRQLADSYALLQKEHLRLDLRMQTLSRRREEEEAQGESKETVPRRVVDEEEHAQLRRNYELLKSNYDVMKSTEQLQQCQIEHLEYMVQQLKQRLSEQLRESNRQIYMEQEVHLSADKYCQEINRLEVKLQHEREYSKALAAKLESRGKEREALIARLAAASAENETMLTKLREYRSKEELTERSHKEAKAKDIMGELNRVKNEKQTLTWTNSQLDKQLKEKEAMVQQLEGTVATLKSQLEQNKTVINTFLAMNKQVEPGLHNAQQRKIEEQRKQQEKLIFALRQQLLFCNNLLMNLESKNFTSVTRVVEQSSQPFSKVYNLLREIHRLAVLLGEDNAPFQKDTRAWQLCANQRSSLQEFQQEIRGEVKQLPRRQERQLSSQK